MKGRMLYCISEKLNWIHLFFFNLVTIDNIRVMFLPRQVETTRQQILELEVSDQQP